MRKIIQKKANVDRIVEHLRRTWAKAKAYGGEVAAAAEVRLAPALADIDAALEARAPALAADVDARAVLGVWEKKSRMCVCSVNDDLHTALGRPRENRFMDIIFPEGVGTYNLKDVSRRPTRLAVLKNRIEGCEVPQVPDEERTKWAGYVDATRTGVVKALADADTTEGTLAVADAHYRTVVHVGQDRLRLFKRDLENAGLTKAQIFEIIPDDAPTAPKAPKTPSTEPTTPPNPTPKAV